MLLVKLILQVLAVALAILVNRLDYWWSDKRTRKFKLGRRALLVLSGAFLIGSVVVTVNDDVQNRLQREELTARLDSLTGGNNYCHVEFDGGADARAASEVLLHVINAGKTPAYDVVIQIVDVLDAERVKATTSPSEAPYTVLQRVFQKTLGPIAPQTAVSLAKDLLRLPERNAAVYEIHIQQRNGTVAQVVRFERVSGLWTFATKATRLNETTVLWQQIDSAYPKQNIDNADW